MDAEQTIKTISDAMEQVDEVDALFLSGSFGNGLADAYSDIDFIVVAEEGASDRLAGLWREAVALTGEIVLWWDRRTVPVLINAITEDWTRTDALFLKPTQLGAQSQDVLRPLFDRSGLYETLPKIAPDKRPDPARFLYQIEEFIRILGLLHLVDGRQEYVNGVLGVYHLRNQLVELMIAETNAPNRGGILHLNRLLTEEQLDILRRLPVPMPTREGVFEAHLAYAKVFLPLARRRAGMLSVEWPEAFEEATWAKLRETIGVDCPYARPSV